MVVTLKSTKYDIFNPDGSVAIKAGTPNVRCAFRSSHLVRNTLNDKIYSVAFDTQLAPCEVRLNKYRLPHSKIWIHA